MFESVQELHFYNQQLVIVTILVLLVSSDCLDNTQAYFEALHHSNEILLFLEINFMKSYIFSVIELNVSDIAKVMYITNISSAYFQFVTFG